MLKFTITFLFAIATLLSLAQTRDTFKISGVIVTNVAATLIPGSMIQCAKKKVYLTDSLGRFSIRKLSIGPHKLTFSGVGFPNKDTVIDIENDNVTNVLWPVNIECKGPYNTKRALSDLENNKATLLVVGGFAPITYATDVDFKKKYGVGYDISGCLPPDLEECMVQYNQTIFEYLDKKHGSIWRKEVRKDVEGLKHKRLN